MTLPLKTPRPRSPMMPRKFSAADGGAGRVADQRVVVDVLTCPGQQQAEQFRPGSRAAQRHRNVVANEACAEVEVTRGQLGPRRKLRG